MAIENKLQYKIKKQTTKSRLNNYKVKVSKPKYIRWAIGYN